MQTDLTANSELSLKEDMDLFETSYRALLNGTSLLYEPKFHLGITLLMNAVLLLMAFMEKHEWYSYIFCTVVMVMMWYIYYLTNAVRTTIKSVSQQEGVLNQMRSRRNILNQLSGIRIMTTVQLSFIFVTILSFRTPDRWFNTSGIVVISCTVTACLASLVYNQRKVGTANRFLDVIIARLEI